MSNKIGIVMGGYLDENEKLMTRQELNCRITSIQKENIELQSQLEQKDKRIKELEEQAAIANNLILTAKKQFAPHTTNSDADAYIEKYLAKPE